MPRYLYDVTNLHTRPPEAKPRTGRRKASHNAADPTDIAACLTCTAKKCTGAAACFKRRKKELAD